MIARYGRYNSDVCCYMFIDLAKLKKKVLYHVANNTNILELLIKEDEIEYKSSINCIKEDFYMMETEFLFLLNQM